MATQGLTRAEVEIRQDFVVALYALGIITDKELAEQAMTIATMEIRIAEEVVACHATQFTTKREGSRDR